MAKNLYNLAAVTTVNDSDLLHVNQGSVSSDKKVTKANLLKEVNSSITSLNSSLTKSSSSYTVNSNVSVLRLVCYKVAGIFVCSGVVVLSSAFTTGASLFKLSSIIPVNTIDFVPYVAGGSPPWYVDTSGWVHCNGTISAGTYSFNFCGSLA